MNEWTAREFENHRADQARQDLQLSEELHRFAGRLNERAYELRPGFEGHSAVEMVARARQVADYIARLAGAHVRKTATLPSEAWR